MQAWYNHSHSLGRWLWFKFDGQQSSPKGVGGSKTLNILDFDPSLPSEPRQPQNSPTNDQYILKQNCWAVISPKIERTNLIFYPDSPEILETWNPNSSFKHCQDRKTNSSVCFLGEVTARQFCFEIYWPLVQVVFVITVQPSLNL